MKTTVEAISTNALKGGRELPPRLRTSMQGTSAYRSISVDRKRCEKIPAGADVGAVRRPAWSKATAAAHASSPAPQIPELPGAALLREFDTLYQDHYRRVYRQCLRMIRNPEDAEDLTQEVFLQLFRKVHTFRGDSSFSTWLHRLTVNTVLMSMRRISRAGVLLTSLDTGPASEQVVSDIINTVKALPSSAAIRLEKIGLDIAMARLSSGYKDIFVLHDVEGFRHNEIAKLLGISEGTSKSQLHKARLRLRLLLQSGRRARFKRVPPGRERFHELSYFSGRWPVAAA